MHWVSDTDDGNRRRYNSQLSKLGFDITVMYNNQQNNISEQNYYSSVNLDNSNFSLSFIWWIFLYTDLFTTSVLGSVRSASCSSIKRLKLSRSPHLKERNVTESKNHSLLVTISACYSLQKFTCYSLDC